MDKIVIIEDDETMLSLIQTLLEIEGFEVSKLDREGDQPSVIQELRREKPALVLLDVHLRHFNGLDLLGSIRKDEELKSTRVLMSSGMELSYQCYQAGTDGFILKPYMPDELIDMIRKTLSGT